MDDVLASGVSAVAALDEPTRLRLYAHVVRQPVPVSRDEVAAALRIPRATVAFHLDKLVAEGLLTATFERRTERAGPGAGRPSKVYRRSGRQVTVSLPERQYELAGLLMAGAVAAGGGAVALADQARAAGERLGAAGGDLAALLERHGFEPAVEGDRILLRNCPFDALARAHPDVVCGMALGLVQGMIAGLGDTRTARPGPLPGHCCVLVEAGA